MTEFQRIYIHVPFCSSKCGYCSFYSVPSPDKDAVDSYLFKFQCDIEKANLIYPLKSLYIGGGTPSYLSEQQMEKLFAVLSLLNLADNPEISIECNPESLTDSKIKLISAFANRVSLGVQSFNKQYRKAIGRIGSEAKITSITEDFLNSGISNISCDLIYGIPSQSIKDFESDLRTLLKLPIKHFSAYSLTIEENSKLDGTLSRVELERIDEVSSKIWEILPGMIRDTGFKRYEISNYALDGYECDHNYAIWFGANYLGFGPTASSFDGNDRWTNPDLFQWNENQQPVLDLISYEKRVCEVFAMGLRTSETWNIKDRNDEIEINSRFGYLFRISRAEWNSLFNKLLCLKEQGFIVVESRAEKEFIVKSTVKGLAFWNDIALELI